MGINFNIKFNVKKKFIFDGKEYKSIEEMPENIRAAYKAAIASGKRKSLFAASAAQQAAQKITGEEERARAMAKKAIEPMHTSKGSRFVIVVAAIVLLLAIFYFLTQPGTP